MSIEDSEWLPAITDEECQKALANDPPASVDIAYWMDPWNPAHIAPQPPDPPDPFSFVLNSMAAVNPDMPTLDVAMHSNEWQSLWVPAINKERNTLIENGTGREILF